jgi:predicted small secreted protein
MNKFKITEYLGIAIIALPTIAALSYFILNEKNISIWKQPKVENVDSVGSFVLVEPVKVEIKKIEIPVVKKEPIKKVDSIVKPKEIKEEIKKDTLKTYTDGLNTSTDIKY